MKKRKIQTLVYAMGAAMLIGMSGCSPEGNDPRGMIDTVTEDEDPTPTPEDEVDVPPVIDDISELKPEKLDYGSREALLEFLAGEWKQVDKISGKELGILGIDKDGGISFLRDGSKEVCKGSLDLEQDYNKRTVGLDWYNIVMDEVPDEYKNGQNITSIDSGGYFHIAQTAEEDLLYLEEVGNGDSVLSYCLFNGPDNEELSAEWVFCRENRITGTDGCQKNGQFYAMLWEHDENGLLLQEMKAIAFETANDYTGYRYMGGIFDESAYPQAVWYKTTADPDLEMVLDEKRYNSSYPADIYIVYTDENGDITQILDVNDALFGEYELYSLPQDIGFSGVDLKINDMEYTLEDLGNVGNNIEGYTLYGDYAVIEAHLNPHRSIYTFYNLRSAWPERTVAAWKLLMGDDVYDYFYSDMDCVYDSEDHLIYKVDGTEIVDMSIQDEKHINIEYWKDDMTTVYEDIIDRPECFNAPIYAYAEYCRNQNAYTWADFIRYAPDDALFMVMVNPPSDNAWDFYMPQAIGDGGSDTVYVVALQDDTEIGFGGGESVVLDKGEIKSYSLTVPEGMPMYTIYAVTPDGRSSEWPVMIISGKDPIHCAFGE